jgi:hypothetical protein
MRTILVSEKVDEELKKLRLRESSFYDYLAHIGSRLSIISYNDGQDNLTAILSLEDFKGFLFSEREDMFVKDIDRCTFVRDYLPAETLYYSEAEVTNEETQLFSTLVINGFKEILSTIPSESGIILNISPDPEYKLFIDKILKCKDLNEYQERRLAEKMAENPILMDIAVISTDPYSNYILQETITTNASVDLKWTPMIAVNREELIQFIITPTYQPRRKLSRKRKLTPSTTLIELERWLKLPISPTILEYFYNSFKLQREAGITVGKLMNGYNFNITLSDLPLYAYASSRAGGDLIKHIVHNDEINTILIDTTGLGEEIAKELEIIYLRPPFFGFNPIVMNSAILNGILRALNVRDPALQRVFVGLVNTLPNPTIPEIYRLLHNVFYADIIPHTNEDWITYLLDFKKLSPRTAQHLIGTLRELIDIKDIRKTLSEDTVPLDVLKKGVIISIPVTEYGERIANTVASLLLLKLYYMLKDEEVTFIVNTHDNLPIIDFLITRLNFKRIIYISRSPVIPSQSFKLRLYDFKRRNVFFVDGYKTLAQIDRVAYPIVRKNIITENYIPRTVIDLPKEAPIDLRKRMNGVIRLMINSEFTSIDELLGRVQAVQDIVISPSPMEISLFLENLKDELRKVHRSDLGFRLILVAYLYYVKKGYLDIRPANQRPDTIRSDLEIPSVYIVVEIEAENPFKAIEQVRKKHAQMERLQPSAGSSHLGNNRCIGNSFRHLQEFTTNRQEQSSDLRG